MIDYMKCYIYDFDGTIYNGDSSLDFILFCFSRNKKLIFLLPKYVWNLIKYILKIINKTKFKQVIFSYLKYLNTPEKEVERFWKKNEYKIKDFYKIKNHKNDIIISASPYFLIHPIAKKYKVFDIIASEVDINSGKFNKENCHGEEKVKRLKQKYPDVEICEVYTDSLADIPLINISKKSYIVKKNEVYEYKMKGKGKL